MATPSDRSLDELIAELAQAKQRVQAIYGKLRNARDATLPRIGRTDDGALIVAGYLEIYYTVLETFFVRVSGFFENDLASARWHTALLEKMNLEIEGVRAKVVGDTNLVRLRELLRFRHFRRYYVEMEYDWVRIDFLLATLDAAHPAVLADLQDFEVFLRAVREYPASE
ncbi:MAG: hypothetical protein OXH96_01350 [Spirochaetaceae bacterium]|nr:hypothetical protein [Spirochaetaceae bacterium]